MLCNVSLAPVAANIGIIFLRRRYNVQTDEVVGAMATEKTANGVHVVKSKGDTKGSSAAVTIKVERTPVPPELQSALDSQQKEL